MPNNQKAEDRCKVSCRNAVDPWSCPLLLSWSWLVPQVDFYDR